MKRLQHSIEARNAGSTSEMAIYATPIPEPGTTALVALGLAALSFRWYRERILGRERDGARWTQAAAGRSSLSSFSQRGPFS